MGVDDEPYRAYAERGELVTRDGKTITDVVTWMPLAHDPPEHFGASMSPGR